MHTIQSLRDRLAELTAERAQAEEDASPLRARMCTLNEAQDRVQAVMWNERAHTSDREAAKRERSAILAEKGPTGLLIQAVDRQVENLSAQMREISALLHRTEYECISIATLQEQGREISSQLREIDTRLDSLTVERESLHGKRSEAEAGADAVNAAETELTEAREALDRQQGESFISGRDTDIAPYTARIAKAEKRVEATKRNASAGRAALPRINARLADIAEEQAAIKQQREELSRQWWTNRARQAEARYIVQVRDMLNTLRDLVALDKLTGRNLGGSLLDAMRHNLRIPVNGRHTEPVNFATWFGSGLVPDVAAAIARLQSDFGTELRGE